MPSAMRSSFILQRESSAAISCRCVYSAAPQSAVLLTTPGAGKWYRSAGPWASQKLCFDVGGSLEWLPQETIVFDGALADIACEVNLGADASYIGWEILCLGRAGSGERFNKGQDRAAQQDFQKWRPLWRERGAIDPSGRLMHAPAGSDGKSVCATLIAAAPEISRSVVAACREVGARGGDSAAGTADRASSR